MLGMWWMSSYEGSVETLRLTQSPHQGGLGIYEDEEGARWDVRAIVGEHVCARRMADFPGFYSTAGFVGNSGMTTGTLPNPVHRWLPYRVEIVEESRMANGTADDP